MHDLRGGVVLSASDAQFRVVEPSQFVADTDAFIDVRLPRSIGKASYSFIGPGVSQNAAQTINITEPHGFNIGAASMGHNGVNNQHLHFTAEVFLCTRGQWKFNIGEHGEQSLNIGPGDIFSAPTWVFRGFENLGADDGWLFVALGGDDTGGILWAPQVLELAGKTGLYLGADYSIRDALAGDNVSDAIGPLSAEELHWVRTFTDEQLQDHLVRSGDLDWSEQSTLPHAVTGHKSALAPVIGFGMSQDRDHAAPITNPHSFSMEWLKVEPGNSIGSHRHSNTQVVFFVEGLWEVEFNRGAESQKLRPVEGSLVSVPARAWRNFSNIGTATALAVVVNGGDARTLPEFSPDLIKAAATAGWELDAGGYIAPTGLAGRP